MFSCIRDYVLQLILRSYLWKICYKYLYFFQVLDENDHKLAKQNEYNFDHPDAFDFDLLIETLRKLKEGKSVDVPIYNFVSHSREKRMVCLSNLNFITSYYINFKIVSHTISLVDLSEKDGYVFS